MTSEQKDALNDQYDACRNVALAHSIWQESIGKNIDRAASVAAKEDKKLESAEKRLSELGVPKSQWWRKEGF